MASKHAHDDIHADKNKIVPENKTQASSVYGETRPDRIPAKHYHQQKWHVIVVAQEAVIKAFYAKAPPPQFATTETLALELRLLQSSDWSLQKYWASLSRSSTCATPKTTSSSSGRNHTSAARRHSIQLRDGKLSAKYLPVPKDTVKIPGRRKAVTRRALESKTKKKEPGRILRGVILHAVMEKRARPLALVPLKSDKENQSGDGDDRDMDNNGGKEEDNGAANRPLDEETGLRAVYTLPVRLKMEELGPRIVVTDPEGKVQGT